MKPLTTHWADIAAARVVAAKGNQQTYTLASGITPSGTVHIGNFREVITVDFVARAMRSLGKSVRFIYSWDDFDTFRKVPVNLPKQEEMTKELRRPISRIPDPRGIASSYAAYNIEAFEKHLPEMGIKPEFLYQQERYSAGLYAESIRKALEHTSQIKAVLDEFRSTPLSEDWLPTAIYCEACGRDTMDYQRYDGNWDYSYACSSCKHEATTDIRSTKNLKLNWRTDWPMRWAFEKVDFEPGGKDHSSDGGSFDTAKRIVAEVWQREAPLYLQYDFVSIKGGPGKMSSSSGNVVDLPQILDIYAPELVRWIFARQKPNTDFAIAFDEDVFKIHDEFDRAEQLAYEPEPETASQKNKWTLNRRTIELALPSGEFFKEKPFRASFRLLSNRLQICDGDIDRVLEKFYRDEVRSEVELRLFRQRAKCAWNWLQLYAPDEFKYRLNETKLDVQGSEQAVRALQLLSNLIQTVDLDQVETADLNQMIYDDVIRASEVEPKDFFRVVYRRLINRDQGPRLPSFLKEIGKDRLIQLL